MGAVIIPERARGSISAEATQVTLFLADRSETEVDTWYGELMIEDRTFRVAVHALGDMFMIGREVLDQMEICFEFGQRVRIRFDPAQGS